MSAPATRPALDSLARDFAAHIERTPVASSTARAYIYGVTQFASWLGEQAKHAYDEVVSDEVVATHAARDFRRYLLTERKLKPKTVDSALTSLGALYLWFGMARPNVASATPSRPPEPKSLDEDQLRDVLRASERRGIRDHTLVMLLYTSGLRISEAAALDVDDVPVSERKGLVHVRAGKGDKPRDVPIEFQTAISLLNRWIRVRRDDYRMPVDQGPLFVTRKGDRLAVRSIHYVVHQCGEVAGVELTPHTLRHTFARTMIDRGEDVTTVADMLGHASLNTTRGYTTSRRSHRESAAASLAIDY